MFEANRRSLGVLFGLILAAWWATDRATGAGPDRPALRSFSTIVADPVGGRLQGSLIWTGRATDKTGEAVAFRREFDAPAVPGAYTLSIFADARYVLWVNGVYVDRGPSRFQPNGPQYDVIDLSRQVRGGRNVLAILVVGNLSGGKVMSHRPGLAARLSCKDREVMTTDSNWKWTDRTRFVGVTASWADLNDGTVDARVEDGDWTAADYDDKDWHPAVAIGGDGWGPLTRTLIPPLRETPVPYTMGSGGVLPVTLRSGQSLTFDTGRIVQAYPVLDVDADAGTELTVKPFGLRYIARAGRQVHFTIDSRGFSTGVIAVKTGRATVHGFRLIERLYPYDRLGAFESDDPRLDKLWQMCARSCEVLSEDSYVDCADRERVEWMDDTPPGYDLTRTMMAGPGDDGTPVYGDPRLLGAVVRRTGLTLQPDGWVKAHTCSDRYDIHARMEDRACAWVQGERQYYEATGDRSILRQTWPAVVSQMNYFLARRTMRGLVRCRDWVVWGNPTGYLVGETTPLNAFVYRALVDAAYLGEVVGDRDSAVRFTAAAVDLGRAINAVLWDDQSGGYFAGWFDDADAAAVAAGRHPLKVVDHRARPTLHSNVFALDRGVVPGDRQARVAENVLRQQHDDDGGDPIMIYYYTTKLMYGLDRPELDRRVLDLFRRRWAGMVHAPWQCSWEGFGSGSKAHIYGMYPGYFLSAYVLGVRREWAVADRVILVEPHLGDLTRAAGTVVTEFGPVPVSWKLDGAALEFTIEVPVNVRATLLLPIDRPGQAVSINGVAARHEVRGGRLAVELSGGRHTGRVAGD